MLPVLPQGYYGPNCSDPLQGPPGGAANGRVAMDWGQVIDASDTPDRSHEWSTSISAMAHLGGCDHGRVLRLTAVDCRTVVRPAPSRMMHPKAADTGRRAALNGRP